MGYATDLRRSMRFFWYRTDKGILAFAAVLVALAVLFGFLLQAVFSHQDQTRELVRQIDRRNLECLARNVYFEARGEPLAGQFAVAEVTMNRKASRLFRRTVCGVVYEKSAFSWTDHRTLPEPAGEEWERAQKVAEAVYYGKYAPVLDGALYFHATYVNPDWAQEKRRIARIGAHVFYR
jgi:spore germination cell wall hydrolase CwlJ-like protein